VKNVGKRKIQKENQYNLKKHQRKPAVFVEKLTNQEFMSDMTRENLCFASAKMTKQKGGFMLLPQETLKKLQAVKMSLPKKPTIITRPIIVENYKVYCAKCALVNTKDPFYFRTEKNFNCYICNKPL